ncbi:MAG: site-2 protease family protein [Acidobacteriaceae bacterium]|nr:site-2 protease family protein [Acidobacteriaceae bacterium]
MRSSEAGQPRRRWWLHGLLFALTLVSTTAFGYALTSSFAARQPLDEVFLFGSYRTLFAGNHAIWPGALYSVPVLLILLSHEMGHYMACRRWSVDATLPFFLPSPTLLGTLGAFIRIPSPIYSRGGLFDVGVSGPIAGFVVLVPILAGGVYMSRVVPGVNAAGGLVFGTPLLLRVFEALRFPGIPVQSISLHPVAMAAWAGLLATAVNLFPAGQLDGGHIVYALAGEQAHKIISRIVMLILVGLGFFWPAWWLWAVMLFFFRRHPLVYDEEPLGRKRITLASLALAILVVSLAVVPVEVK